MSRADFSQPALDRARLLRANYREALMNGINHPDMPLDIALDLFDDEFADKQLYGEVIHILSLPEEEIQ